MKRFLPLILAGVTAAGAFAQSKINPAGQMMLQDYYRAVEEQRLNKGNDPVTIKTTVADPQILAIVRLKDAADISALEQAGYSIKGNAGDMVLVPVSLSEVEELAALDQVQSLSFGETMRAMLDFARPSGEVTPVQNGFDYNGVNTTFDGAGVVVGMMDQGLEANHINFKNADGTSRIQRLYWLDSTNGNYQEYTADDIDAFTTDLASGSHATHVAGILGGSYRGEGTYISLAGSGNNILKELQINGGSVPYYGVATGGDLAFSVGSFQDANLMVGVENIMNYAQEEGKPVVVNMSIGSNVGPHDGTDNLTRYLNNLAKRGIICISAGNEGADNMSIFKSFTSINNTIMTGMPGNKGDGQVDIWGADNKPFTVKWSIYDTSTRTDTEIMSVTAAGQSRVSSTSSAFTSNFNGTISMMAQVDENNQRYNVYCNVNSVSPKLSGTRYLLLTVTGTAGQKVWVYGNRDVTFARNGITGASNGSPENSINNLACGSDMLSVGSYNSRITWPALRDDNAGTVWQYNGKYEVGAISPFSSYGATFQGRELPLITAPGAAIISSYSSYVVNSKGTADEMAACVTRGNRKYYWGQMQGTSMSCPFVTGTIGLWLQADPSLKFADVMEVIENTSVRDYFMEEEPQRWGAGKLDALAGIKYILDNRAAIGTVFADDDSRLVVTSEGGRVTAHVAGATRVEASLYSVSGRAVTAARGADEAVVVTENLPAGIYILSVESSEGHFARKITVK